MWFLGLEATSQDHSAGICKAQQERELQSLKGHLLFRLTKYSCTQALTFDCEQDIC